MAYKSRSPFDNSPYSAPNNNAEENHCFHCGESMNIQSAISFDAKPFCCAGCKTVYQILNKHGLCE